MDQNQEKISKACCLELAVARNGALGDDSKEP